MSSTSLRGSLDRYRITEEDSTRERTKNGNCAIDSLTELPYKRVDAPLFIVSLDHIRHLQVDSAMVGSMLFLSLEICDGLKSKVIFSFSSLRHHIETNCNFSKAGFDKDCPLHHFATC
jgi:hypothetical protein